MTGRKFKRSSFYFKRDNVSLTLRNVLASSRPSRLSIRRVPASRDAYRHGRLTRARPGFRDLARAWRFGCRIV